MAARYQLLRDFFDQIPDALFFKDQQGRYLLVNAAMGRRVGLAPEQILGKTDSQIFAPSHSERILRDDQDVQRTGQPIIDKVDQEKAPNGEVRYLSTTLIPHYDPSAKLRGVMGMTRDVTRRLQFERLREERLLMERKLLMLEDMNRVKSDFVSAVSHELRTPLAIVKQLFMLVYDETAGPINDQQRELLVKANVNIDRLKNIIDELLDISRIEGNKFSLSYSLVNLNELLKESQPFFEQLAAERRIELRYQIPSEEILLFVDAERLQQIVTNLINNAIKFTPDEGRIIVEVAVLRTKVRIGVFDNGPGIPADDLPKIFWKFVQLPGRDEGVKNTGIGLGLSIVKSLVEKHGGEIWAESAAGEGSKFFFTLPRFYTADALHKKVRDQINVFLANKQNVSLVNMLVLNYADFKRRVDIQPKELFANIKEIVGQVLRETQSREAAEALVLSDLRSGICSVILPGTCLGDDSMFCDLVRQRIKKYFIANALNEVFIALGYVYYSNDVPVREGVGSNLNIQEIYIGSEMRLFKRIRYHAEAEVTAPGRNRMVVETQDLSMGGLCFVSSEPFSTDDRVELAFTLLKKDIRVKATGRVSWTRRMDPSPGDAAGGTYRIGVEFTKLSAKDRQALSKELKLYYE